MQSCRSTCWKQLLPSSPAGTAIPSAVPPPRPGPAPGTARAAAAPAPAPVQRPLSARSHTSTAALPALPSPAPAPSPARQRGRSIARPDGSSFPPPREAKTARHGWPGARSSGWLQGTAGSCRECGNTGSGGWGRAPARGLPSPTAPKPDPAPLGSCPCPMLKADNVLPSPSSERDDIGAVWSRSGEGAGRRGLTHALSSAAAAV